MKTHTAIDERSLALARAIAAKIDDDPSRAGVTRARLTCERWLLRCPSKMVTEWLQILELQWEQIRSILLDESEDGCRLRQNSPFCGILAQEERLEIFRRYCE